MHDGVFVDSLHSRVASVDPHPHVVFALAAQADPVAVSVIVISLRVVTEEFLDL